MKKLESVGWLAKLGSQITTYFSAEEYRERVKNGLIFDTLDGIVDALKEQKRVYKRYSVNDDVNKLLNHFVKQYNANRKKIK